MGGKKHGGQRVTREEAGALFREIMVAIGQLDQFSASGIPTNAVLAGSYRRGKPDSGDLDIVLIPEMMIAFNAWCLDHFGLLKNGKVARTGLYKGVQVEFYVASEVDWGTQLLMWTGSMQHNVVLRKAAKRMGYSLSQYGFKDSGGLLTTCATEEAVYKFLDMEYVEPHAR
jgi:DNA polymerase/3'-5' exonuclease PolX